MAANVQRFVGGDSNWKSGLITIIFVLLFAGCNHEDRISRLEKGTQQLKEEIGKQRSTVDYDLQAKCGKDSSTWFNENWHEDKSTLLLTYSNHYNKKSNKCFVIVEYHTRYNKDWWANLETLWDLYENAKDGSLSINHYTDLQPEFHVREEISECEVNGKKCQTMDEFNSLVRPYLTE